MIAVAYPKINIGLCVLRKREDGYHDLDTLFYPLTGCKWNDVLEINKAEAFSIAIEGADWDPLDDLTAKAWRLLRDEYGIGPVSIRIRKGIPVGAGLGGGSSDCALALKMISSLYGLNLSNGTLEQLAGRLGSDCAFFICNTPQWGSGRGEILTPASIDLSDYEILLKIPEGSHISTAEAYRGIHPHIPEVQLRDALAQPITQWKGKVVNDFEASVFPSHPEIAALKQQLYNEGALYASMTGSGSAVFGIFGTSPQALRRHHPAAPQWWGRAKRDGSEGHCLTATQGAKANETTERKPRGAD